jgi:5'-AMP-activated protein kinase, regulatory gamma subunit
MHSNLEGMEETKKNVRLSVSKFLETELLYEMLPNSGQVLILEKGLCLLDVIELSLSHRQEAGVVWDPFSMDFIGIVTDRDMLNIIISQYDQDDMELEESQIITRLKNKTLEIWRQECLQTELLYVNPDDNLLIATKTLKQNRLHRIPIIDKKETMVLGILSIEAILRFFVENYIADSSLFDVSMAEFSIGTKFNIITTLASNSLIQALTIMAKQKLSSLPLLDDQNKIVGVMFLSDIPQIIRSGLYLNPHSEILSVVDQVNENGDCGLSRFGLLNSDDTLKSMIQKLAASPERKIYRIIEGRLDLIITESDLFGYLMIE